VYILTPSSKASTAPVYRVGVYTLPVYNLNPPGNVLNVQSAKSRKTLKFPLDNADKDSIIDE